MKKFIRTHKKALNVLAAAFVMIVFVNILPLEILQQKVVITF